MRDHLFKKLSGLLAIEIIAIVLSTAAIAAEEQKEISLGIAEQIGNFYAWALGIGGLIALGALVLGGILYTASAGNASRQDDAKQWIVGALVGLLILFGAWFILNIINPNLLKLTDLTLLVNKGGGGSNGSGNLPPPPPVIDGQACPVGTGLSYSNDFCGGNLAGNPRFPDSCLRECPGKPNCHGATDIFAPLHTPIYAVDDGTIGSSWGWNDVGGYRLHLITDAGVDYYYAHLDGLPVVPAGTRVKAGDLLGYVDASGDAQGTPNHLHFEIHPTGQDSIVVNPYSSLLQRVCSK